MTDESHADESSNTLGVIGLLLAFCLPPLGLVLSLVALGRQPRGFAITGVFVGVVTTGLVVCEMPWSRSPTLPSSRQIANAAEVYVDYQATEVGAVGRTIDTRRDPVDLGVAEEHAMDPWGNRYRIDPDASGWVFRSAGPDGAWDTGDDIDLTRGMAYRKALARIASVMRDDGTAALEPEASPSDDGGPGEVESEEP